MLFDNNIILLFLVVFTLLSIADLHFRVLPGMEVVFLGSVAVAAPSSPWVVGAVVLTVGWGMLTNWPSLVMVPILIYPGSWPVALVGAGVRLKLVGRGDLLAAGSLAVLFPWPALILSLMSLELWRRWWSRRRKGPVPALPGMFAGVAIYSVVALSIAV